MAALGFWSSKWYSSFRYLSFTKFSGWHSGCGPSSSALCISSDVRSLVTYHTSLKAEKRLIVQACREYRSCCCETCMVGQKELRNRSHDYMPRPAWHDVLHWTFSELKNSLVAEAELSPTYRVRRKNEVAAQGSRGVACVVSLQSRWSAKATDEGGAWRPSSCHDVYEGEESLMWNKSKPKASFKPSSLSTRKNIEPMNDLSRDAGIKERLKNFESHHLGAHHKL